MRNRHILPFIAAFAVCGLAASGSDTVIKNATILTVTKGTQKSADLWIHDGKIAGIGKGLKVPTGAKVIDGTGKFVMPGVIDAHSHLASDGGLNESSETVSAEVDVEDVINEKDPGIKWALAGGVTVINTMHGSANPIGGLTATLKLRWGKNSEDLKFIGARRHIKFALGENPKRVHDTRGVTTRLGVAETFRKTFDAAREYQRDWDDYKAKTAKGEKAIPPRRDLKLDSIVGVLKGDIWVQCHCYRADEIEMMLKLSDEYGFHIGALQHVLEGYKMAPEIAARKIGASTFADFWGYKVEAYDGNVFNPAALARWNVVTSVNSDSGERIRRLNLDAAKSLRYGGLTDDQCLALVTYNAAWQLGVEKRIGSLELGKDADISIWDAHPLSCYSKCMMTLVDGDVYFERKADGSTVYGLVPPPPTTVIATPRVELPTVSSFVAVNSEAKLPKGGTFALTGVRIVTVSGPVIARGTVLVEEGIIKAVGEDVSIPSGTQVIRMDGSSVYPGFVNAIGNLGLTEIPTVAEGQDLGEPGIAKAHIRAADAFHVQSAWVGLTRCAGITTSIVTPRGTGWMGQAALMHTGGRTVEESTVLTNAAYPLSMSGAGSGDFGTGPTIGSDEVKKLTGKALKDALAYGAEWEKFKSAPKGTRPPRKDMFLEALVPVARRERPVLMNANGKSDIDEALAYAKENNIRIVLSGCRDADTSARDLNIAGVPVIFADAWSMAGLTTGYDVNFAGPNRLFKAGVKFCIATTDYVNLPQIAAQSAAFGLPADEALKAITLYPAEILGVGHLLGSIEPGKIADLLVTDGDPLEYKTHYKRLFVNGIDTPLVSRHSQLYDEFKKK